MFGSFGGGNEIYTGDIPASLRFRGAASAYLSKTFGSALTGLGRIWTISFWCKRTRAGTDEILFGARNGAAGPFLQIGFTSTNKLLVGQSNGTNWIHYQETARLFRDPTSWYHITITLDTTVSSPAADRLKIFVNNERDTAGASPVTGQNDQWSFAHNTVVSAIGAIYQTSPTYFFDGYLSRVCFVDGQALTPSSFGYQNTEINEWVTKTAAQVKAVVDAGGTNSFMLDFNDATSLTTLGYDYSSKGNNWTLNNFSLTAGTSYDRMLDVPGNSFATLNPLDKSGAGTLSSGNLIFTQAAATDSNSRLTLSQTEKTYIELENTGGTAANNAFGFGIALKSLPITSCVGTGGVAGVYAAYASNISWLSPGSGSTVSTGAAVSANTVSKIAFDPVAGKLWLGRGTTWYDSAGGTTGDPSAGTNPTFTGLSGDFAVFTSIYAMTVNQYCGQAPLHASATYHSAAGGYFRYAPPTGYKALCQRNLPDPAILNPEKHFDVVTRNGFGASGGSITSLRFQPDFLWEKSRNAANSHNLWDSIRGVNNSLFSNLTNAETAYTNFLTAFNSSGYSFGANDWGTGVTLVDWLWKAGGAAVTNNAGSITSQVSANVTAGFSIVAYTGTGANATVGHGLGKAPGLVIVKRRGTAGWEWAVWHSALAASEYLFLNSTGAKATASSMWNSTAPTSTVFTVGSASQSGAADTFVAYCFAEIPGYSKAFSYTGNGSADGPYVHCGFKPKLILVKRTDSSTYGNWEIIDTVRDTYNQAYLDLSANLSAVENATDGAAWDILSNGFKCRDGSATGNKNVSGGTYIGIAFADVPSKYALAR